MRRFQTCLVLPQNVCCTGAGGQRELGTSDKVSNIFWPGAGHNHLVEPDFPAKDPGQMLVAKLAQLSPANSVLVALQVDEQGVAWGIRLGWLGWKLGGGCGLRCGFKMSFLMVVGSQPLAWVRR